MRITKKNVIVDVTNYVYGMLKQGGVCGRVEAYNLADAETVTGLTAKELRAADQDSWCPGYEGCRISEILREKLTPHVIRTGRIIN